MKKKSFFIFIFLLFSNISQKQNRNSKIGLVESIENLILKRIKKLELSSIKTDDAGLFWSCIFVVFRRAAQSWKSFVFRVWHCIPVIPVWHTSSCCKRVKFSHNVCYTYIIVLSPKKSKIMRFLTEGIRGPIAFWRVFFIIDPNVLKFGTDM